MARFEGEPHPDIEKLKAEGDLDGLIAALSYEADANVRRQAASALGWYVDGVRAAVVGPLVVTFKDKGEEPSVRAAAADALELIDSANALNLFRVALKDEAPEIRATAAASLGKMDNRRAVAPLIFAFNDEDARVRTEVVWALGQVGAQLEDAALFLRVVDTLVAALQGEEVSVCAAAAEALELISALQENVALLAHAVEPLVAALKDRYEDVNIGSIAANVLGNIGMPAVEPLIAALDAGDANVQENAAWALGLMGARLEDAALRARAVERLISAVEEGGKDVRWAAAYALGELGAQLEDPALRARVVEVLVSALEDTRVRKIATHALETIGAS